ncbi:MAG: sulfurtransferase [Planctomycetota bacterium]|nr:MAG: sulfurtransferase [Planctomycetota bacterium]
MKHSPEFMKMVNEAKSRVKECDVDDINNRLGNGEALNLIDCREESEWSDGHIAKAQYIGKGVVERDIENLYPDKNTELIFYCGGGFRSVLVCDSLLKMGYSNVVSMDGGWRSWKDKGFSTE